MTIYLQGIPTEIVIDDQIPCLNGKPMFTKPIGEELWVMLLEKAWAKVFGSYSATEGGLPDLAMEHLLGFPSKGYSFESENSLFTDKTKISALMKDSDRRNHVICAGSKGQGEQKNKGIVSGHAYTIIGVYEKMKDVILKMRNPWGSFEWEGKYNENSKIWTNNKGLAEDLGLVKADDGVFFMTIEEFLGEFDYLGICFYEEIDAERGFLTIKEKMASFFEFEAKKEGDFQIGIHQKLKNFVKEEGFNEYSYSPVDCELYKLNETGGKCDECLAKGDSDRFFGDSSIMVNDQGVIKLAKGKYLLRAKVLWKKEFFTNKQFNGFNLTFLGEKGSFSWKKLEKVQGRGLIRDFFTFYAKKNDKKVLEPKKAWFSVFGFPQDDENDVPRVCIICAGNEEKTQTMELLVTLKTIDNLRLKKEVLKGEKTFNFKLKPGGEEVYICKTVSRNQGFGYGLGAQPKFY